VDLKRRAAALIVLAGALLTACNTVSDSAPPNSGLQAITREPPRPTLTPAPTAPRALVTATPDARTCTDDEVARILSSIPPYHPGGGTFVTLGSAGFVLIGKPFVARGINYYPALTPWQHFPGTDLAIIEHDFTLLRQANVNTIRLFVWYDPLFTCPGYDAVPDPAALNWLDAVIRLASAHAFRVILTLNHLPDLRTEPIYTGYTLPETEYLVSRYRDEPAILAWDLRDGGDADYTPFDDSPAPATRAQVLDWLARTAAAVRQIDSDHLITAGWANDSEGTIPLVDFVSFRHFGDDKSLRLRIAELRGYTDKPLLLIAFGFSTFDATEIDQAQWLRAAVQATEVDHLAGWLVWTMYDFPTNVTCWPEPCASLDDVRHHYGLWNTDGSRKLAADTLDLLAAPP
jgi:hypothetical protein